MKPRGMEPSEGGKGEEWGKDGWLNQPWRACHVDIEGASVGENVWNETL